MDKICPVGKLALFWKVAEEFEVGKSISKVIGKDDKGTSMALLILVFNTLGSRGREFLCLRGRGRIYPLHW